MELSPQEIIREITDHLVMDYRAFVHKETGKILSVPNELDNLYFDEELFTEELEELENNFSNYYEIEKWESREAYNWMVKFAESLEADAQMRNKLFRALEQQKPFARFKYTLEDNLDYLQAWYDFRDEKQRAYVEKALEMLKGG
jgi:hypothetical protein